MIVKKGEWVIIVPKPQTSADFLVPWHSQVSPIPTLQLPQKTKKYLSFVRFVARKIPYETRARAKQIFRQRGRVYDKDEQERDPLLRLQAEWFDNFLTVYGKVLAMYWEANICRKATSNYGCVNSCSAKKRINLCCLFCKRFWRGECFPVCWYARDFVWRVLKWEGDANARKGK